MNSSAIKRHIPSDALAWDDVKIEYNTAQKWIKYRFYLPPEARKRLPVPGGYDNAPWMYTYMPLPGKERKIYMISRIEGHRSTSHRPADSNSL